MFVRLPPTNHEETTHNVLVEANMKDLISQDMLQSIQAADFLPAGRFSHLHIPRYVYVPAEIAAIINVKQERIHSHHVIVWRRLYVASREAQAFIEADPAVWLQRAEEMRDKCPWISMLMDRTIVKSFDFEAIDIVQMAEAIRTIEGSQIHILRNRALYDRLFRPLERLFAYDMPLRDRLHYAMQDCDATDDVMLIMLRLVGLTRIPLNLSARFLTEELSRIRHLRAADFCKLSAMDTPIQLLNQVLLKETHHKRYKEESERESEDSAMSLGMNNECTDGIFQDECWDSLQEIDRALFDCNEALEVIRLQVQEDYHLLSRTNSEEDKNKLLEQIKNLKLKQFHTEKSYTMMWKKYEEVLHKRAASRYSETHNGNASELEIVSSSQSTLQTYLIDWKVTRSDLSREKIGIQLCLSKLPPPTKAALTAADMQYKQTLMVRQVEIECQIGELNGKIEKGEEILDDLKQPIPHRNRESSKDIFWEDDVIEKEYLQGYQPPVKPRSKGDNGKLVLRNSSDTSARSSSLERKKTIRRPEIVPQVYLHDRAVHRQTHVDRALERQTQIRAKMIALDTRQISKAPKPNSSDRARREPTPPQLPTFWGQNVPKPTTRPAIAAARRTASQTWTPVPFARLPESMMYWDGKNSRTAPNWAAKDISALEVVNRESWTTKTDILETEDHFLLKITPAHGVNFDTRVEIKMGLQTDTNLPEAVSIFETSIDRMTSFKYVSSITFSHNHLLSMLLALQDLMTQKFTPLLEDKLRTDMTLWKTNFTEYDGAHVRFDMQLQLLSIHGTTGTERMVRLQRMDTGASKFQIQFPWLHLPRIHKLWWGFYEDAKKQSIDYKLKSQR